MQARDVKVKGLAGLAKLRAADVTAPVHRNPELEAAIADEPDDAASYLVYADALETAGDPRGKLITLQAAAAVRPDDLDVASATARHIEAHRPYFLGALAVRDRGLEIDWFHGFFRRVHLTASSTTDAIELVDALAMLPSSQFLRELEITPETTVSLDANVITDRLIAHRKPATLAHIILGLPKWVVHDDLRQAFPRLGEDAGLLRRLLDAAASNKRMVVRLDLAAVPPLVPRHATTREVDVGLVARALKTELKGAPNGTLSAIQQAFTPGSVAAFVTALFDSWGVAGRPVREAWVGTLHVMICGSSAGRATSLRTLVNNFGEATHGDAVGAVERLVEDGSATAICALYHFATVPWRQLPRRLVARQALEELAKVHQLATIERLMDERCPDDPSPDIREVVIDAQRAWLLDLMVTGRRIARDDFAALVVGNPLRRILFDAVVFVQRGAKGDAPASFRIDTHGTLRRSDGSVHELLERAVGVLHPADSEGVDVEAWRVALMTADLEPSTLQLDRPTYELQPDELEAACITRFAGRIAGLRTLTAWLEPRGWEARRPEGGGPPRALVKQLGRFAIVAELDSTHRSIERVHLADSGRLERLGDVAISELLYELDQIFDRPR